MLEDAFFDFVIDDVEEDEEELKFIKAEDYEPFIQQEKWFFDTKYDDDDNHKATFLYSNKHYSEAYECYLNDLDSRKHNRLHMIAIYDSILRCFAKDSSIDCDVKKFLNLYENLIQNYSDQMQYWDTAIKVLRNINEPWAIKLYITYLSMLCSTVDLPDYWLAFGKCPNIKAGIQAGPNFKLGYLTKSFVLLQDQLQFTHGASKEISTQKMEKIDEARSEFTPEQIAESLQNMDFSMSRRSRDNHNDLSLPVYKCRSEQTALRSSEEIEKISSQFSKQYKWMFANM